MDPSTISTNGVSCNRTLTNPSATCIRPRDLVALGSQVVEPHPAEQALTRAGTTAAIEETRDMCASSPSNTKDWEDCPTSLKKPRALPARGAVQAVARRDTRTPKTTTVYSTGAVEPSSLATSLRRLLLRISTLARIRPMVTTTHVTTPCSSPPCTTTTTPCRPLSNLS